MNRRELLKRGFELGAAGLLLPMVEPIRRYWSLDRTMIPRGHRMSWFTEDGYQGKIDVFPHTVAIGDYTGYPDSITVTKGSADSFRLYDIIYVESEPMWVTGISGRELSVLRF